MSEIEQIEQKIPIGRFSLFTQLTQKALRLYDKKGIIVPGNKDPITGYRYYKVSQIERGIKIKILSKLGFGLSDISLILKAPEQENGKKIINEIFSKNLAETQLEIQRLKKIEELLIENKSIEELYLRTTEPIIKEVPQMRVISKRGMGDYGHTIGKLMGELMEQIHKPDNQRIFVSITGAPMFIAHDPGYVEINADIEVAIPISGRITVDEGFEVKILSAGKIISVLYTGSYNGVGEAYNRAFELCVKNGYNIRDNTREIYMNSPAETPENELLTEIQIPIEEVS